MTLWPLQLVSRRLDGPVAGLGTLTERKIKPRISELQAASLYLHVLGVEPAAARMGLSIVRAGFAF